MSMETAQTTKKWIVTPSPHLHSENSTRSIMLDVIIALIPALIAGFAFFGYRTLAVTGVCVGFAVITEYVCRIWMKRPQTVGDLSAVVTGLLLAMNLPVGIPLWIAAIGAVAAVGVIKQMFGGIGQNFINPALGARIILMLSFPSKMTTWVEPFAWVHQADAVSSATPLGILNEGGTLAELPSKLELFLGLKGGCIGETCAAALILGGLYLIFRKVISPLIPAAFLATVFVLSFLLGADPVVAILTGGVMLGAIFMATDYTTSPLTRSGKLIFAIGCGALTVLIRQFGSLPEGVSFAIVLMNVLVPHIEKLTRPRPFGERGRKA